MLFVKKKSFLPVFHFFREERYFGTLRQPLMIPKATFISKEGNYRFLREKWIEGAFFCMMENSYEAIAKKKNGTGYTFLIKYNATASFLKPGRYFREKTLFHFELYNDDKNIGLLWGDKGKYAISMNEDGELPAIIQCFVFWLGYQLLSSTRGLKLQKYGNRHR